MLTGNSSVLVFDVGGTSLRAGIFDSLEGRLLCSLKRRTPNRWCLKAEDRIEMYRVLFESMHKMGVEVSRGFKPDKVAVAFPGSLNERGQVVKAPAIHGEQTGTPFPLGEELAELWPERRVYLLNDVTAAGYAQVAEGARDFCMVTVSSGVGNKFFISGRPAWGQGGRGGEIGHWKISLDPYAPICDCGERGHLGALASGRGVLGGVRRRALEDRRGFSDSYLGLICTEPDRIDNPSIVQAFLRDDRWTRKCIIEAGGLLGRALGLMHTCTGTERFIIFGGFALALGEKYRQILVEEARKSCWSLGQDWNHMIELGKHQDKQGLLGAGYFANLLDTEVAV